MNWNLAIGLVAGGLVIGGLLLLSMIHVFMIPPEILKKDTHNQDGLSDGTPEGNPEGTLVDNNGPGSRHS